MPTPIDITPPVSTNSPGAGVGAAATSNLTSALRAAGEAGRQANNPTQVDTATTTTTSTSNTASATGGINIAGAKNKDNNNNGKGRRESVAASEGMKSLMGMSWGGVSVGSWIRDDIIMTGTSPFTYQSPSYHSSSYLPKLEANFFRDFSCCGQTLPSLHDLLQHYEEVHAQQLQNGTLNLPQSISKDARDSLSPGGGGMPGSLGGMLRQQQAHQQRMAALAAQNQAAKRGERLGSLSMHGGGGVDVAEEMEMDDDDVTPPPNPQVLSSLSQQQQQQQAQQQHQQQQHLQSGLRLGPQIPHHNPHMNNPTVSSVNTPNLPNPTTPSNDRYMSPESSVPGTPGNSGDFDTLNLQNMTLGNSSYLPMENDMGLELCIDDPGKHLYNHMGTGAPRAPGFPQQMTLSQFQAVQAARNQSELIRRLGAEGYLPPNFGPGASIPGDGTSPLGWQYTEDKPFKCPVIGCEKAYKNQNGLKYHKNHGHTNQQLHQNPDGTLSIVNPETSIPYPGTLGMEKEKPYKCEYCGKRYKNLNGLKYHRGHSTHGMPGLPFGLALTAQGFLITDTGEDSQ